MALAQENSADASAVHRLRPWPWRRAHLCTRRTRHARLSLALLFLGATFRTWPGCILVSARSSCQARMRGSSRIAHRFGLRLEDSATKDPGCARTRPVLSRHGFRQGARPRPSPGRGWYGMGYFLRFALCQPFPRDISQKSSSRRWQLTHITCQNNV